jgi:hypothetical protein
MTLVPIARALCRAGIGFVMVAAFACGLNPQPLPPGALAPAGNDGGPVMGEGSDAAGQPIDATTITATDGGSAPPPEGSQADAGDAEVGSAEAAADAGDAEAGSADASETDGPSDAETDTSLDAVGDEPAEAAASGEERDP